MKEVRMEKWTEALGTGKKYSKELTLTITRRKRAEKLVENILVS